MNNTFSISESIKFGWETFKKDPWFYAGVTLALSIFSTLVNWLTNHGSGIFGIVGWLIGFAASTVVTIAYARLALSASSGQHVNWNGLWAPEHFWRMFGATLLQGIIIVIGFILVIIPGIIAALILCFTQLLVVDKKMQPFEALKESYRLTKGHLLQLFLLMLCLILLNIVGAVLLLVGLLVTVPVTILAIAHVYRKIEALQGVPLVTPQQPGA
jgi:hypothetical protein